jgi:hypothetical protein
MAFPENLSERLQILENLLSTFTQEFQNLKRDLESSSKNTALKTSNTRNEPQKQQEPKQEFAVDREATVISEGFFDESSLRGQQPSAKRNAMVDKDATMVSEGFFDESSLRGQAPAQRNAMVDKDATMVSEGFFDESSLRGQQPSAKRNAMVDKDATMVSEGFFDESSLRGQAPAKQRYEMDKEATVVSDSHFYEELPTSQELETTKAAKTFNLSVESAKPPAAKPPASQSVPKTAARVPAPQNVTDPWA